jgi:hypothetical protein
MAARVARGVAAACAGHACATLYCLRDASAGEPAGTAASSSAAATARGAMPAAAARADEDPRRAGKLATELYRAQKRGARVADAYAANCELVSPALRLHGVKAVSAYLTRVVPSLRPVQLGSSRVASRSGEVEVELVSELTLPLLNVTRVVPMRVRLVLDEDGKVAQHIEEWHGRAPSVAFELTRRLNGWLVALLL